MVKTMPEELLCIDTNVMIWGILKKGQTEQEKQMIDKASLFFERSFCEGKLFAISIITLSEIMVLIPPEDRNEILEILSQYFVILPYDFKAAEKSADIFREQFSKVKSIYHGQRGVLRPDIHILGSILAFNSNSGGKYDYILLITEDKPFRKLADHYIRVQGIPDPPLEQGLLFD